MNQLCRWRIRQIVSNLNKKNKPEALIEIEEILSMFNNSTSLGDRAPVILGLLDELNFRDPRSLSAKDEAKVSSISMHLIALAYFTFLTAAKGQFVAGRGCELLQKAQLREPNMPSLRRSSTDIAGLSFKHVPSNQALTRNMRSISLLSESIKVGIVRKRLFEDIESEITGADVTQRIDRVK